MLIIPRPAVQRPRLPSWYASLMRPAHGEPLTPRPPRFRAGALDGLLRGRNASQGKGLCGCCGTPTPTGTPCGVCGGIHIISGSITDANGTTTLVYNGTFWQAVVSSPFSVSGWVPPRDPITFCCDAVTFDEYYGYLLFCNDPTGMMTLSVQTWAEPPGGCAASPPCPSFPASDYIPYTAYPGGPWSPTDVPPVAMITATATPSCTSTTLTAVFSWTQPGAYPPAPATTATVNMVITMP